MTRFTSDDFVTGSINTGNQQQIIRRQPAPVVDDYVAAPSSGGVSRSSLPPVGGAPASAAVANAPSAAPRIVQRAPAIDPVETASAATTRIDPLSRAVERTAEPARQKVAASDPAGWSSAGGSQVTAKEGETVFNLSRRYGVPAKVLIKANGLHESGQLQAGQKVIIPTYIYSDRAPVSAPDNDPKVAAAKSSRGEKTLEDDARLKEAHAKLEQAPQPKAVASSKAGTYVVESGDSVLGIARDHGVSSKDLRTANGLTNDSIRIGQKLVIPGAGTKVAAKKPEAEKAKVADAPVDKSKAKAVVAEAPVAKPKTTQAAEVEQPKAQPVAYTPPKTKAVEAVVDASDEVAPNSTGIGKMRWPANGRVVSGYGKGAGKSRDGIDIAVPEGTAVKSAENGVVIYAGDGLKEFGNTVLVRHDNGLVTVYGNNGSLNVKRGQKVKRGEQLATSGMTGDATQPKLHFEVRKDSAPVDPSKYLE